MHIKPYNIKIVFSSILINLKTILAVILFFMSSIAIAQDDNPYLLHFKSGVLLPDENIKELSKNQESLKSGFFLNNYHVIIQFYKIPDDSIKEKLSEMGVKLLDYLPNNAYTAVIPTNLDFLKIPKFEIRSIITLETKQKMDEAVFNGFFPEWAIKQSDKVDVSLVLFGEKSLGSILPLLNNFNIEVLVEESQFRTLKLRVPIERIHKLAMQAWVLWIEPVLPDPQDENLPGKTLHRSNVLNDGIRNLTGNNVRIGIWDGGTVGPHVDFSGRLTLAESYLSTDHGTHVAGTMAGAGLIDPYARGMAPKSLVYSYDYNGSVNSEVASAISNYNIVMTQNSWGYGDGFVNCTTKDPYNTNSREQDVNIYNNPYLVHVHSSGNSQTVCSGGWGTTTGKAAKNKIVVANISSSEVISSSSSFGPVQDGRIKPEISALGTSVYSCLPNNTYTGGYSGTSMAAPGVTGTIAQLIERYKQLNSNVNPPASLMKAITCNTAKDLGNAGPDYKHGFGGINGLKAVRAIESTRFVTNNISNGQTINTAINVPAGAKRLKVLICWTDFPALANANPALVNNLDLSVIDPALTAWNPWKLNPASPSSVATRGVDNINNIEQVTIDNPVAGSYTLQINGFSIPQGPQQYALTWEIEEAFLEIIYPNGGEALTPGSSCVIHWDQMGITSNQTLQYSTNNGTSWTTLSSTLSSTTMQYTWTVPSTFTSQTLLKITNGSLSDVSDNVFHILGTPASLTLSNGCGIGDIKVSWNSVTNATHYDVLNLDTVSGVWNIIGADQTALSYNASGFIAGRRYWFAVRAKNNNSSVIGERCIAKSYIAPSTSNLPTSTITPSGPTTFCFGNSIILNANTGTGLTYVWERDGIVLSGLTSSSITVTNSGNYKVIVTNTAACSTASLPRQVIVNSLPIVSLQSFNPICVNSPPITLSQGLPLGGTYSGTGVNAGSFNPTISGIGTYNITYIYTDNNSCTNSATKSIFVDSLIPAKAGNDKSIFIGDSVQIGIAPSGSYNYLWSPSVGLNNPAIANPWAKPSDTATYVLTVTNGACVSVDTVRVNVIRTFLISGNLTYDNAVNTPLVNLKLGLYNGFSIIDSTTTNAAGDYAFSPQLNGIYTISVHNNKPFGGVNSTDALVAQRYFVGLDFLSGLKLKAADVNNSSSVNSSDALIIRRRFSGLITSFPAGDWIYNPDTVIINFAPSIMNFKGICIGDINGSYFPLGVKSTSVDLIQFGQLLYETGKELDIPVKVNSDLELGALSLAMAYDSNMVEIITISSPANKIATIITNINKNNFYIAWSSLLPLKLKKGEVLFTVKVRIKTNAVTNPFISLRPECELADSLANVISGVSLVIPELLNSTLINKWATPEQVVVFPNPSLGVFRMEFDGENGKYELNVYDLTAKLIYQDKFIVNKNKTSRLIDLSQHEKGIYLLKISNNNKLVLKKLILQ